MAITFKRTGKIVLWVLLISAFAAALLVIFGQWMPMLPNGSVIQMGDETIYLGEGATLGAGVGFIAWLAVTGALFVAFFAVVVSLLAVALALLIAAVMLGFTLLALLSPLIVMALLAWWLVHAIKRKNDAPPSAVTTPAAA